MRFLVIVLFFVANQMIAQTTQPSIQEATEQNTTGTKIEQQLRANKQKAEAEKQAANEAMREEIKKTGKMPTTKPARKPSTEKPESIMTEEERMAKYGMAISDKNALGAIPSGPAPNFSGIDQNGNKIELKELIKKGEVVVIFYRGYWCGICNRYLAEFEKQLKTITDKGASVIAITPESNEFAKQTIEKNNLSFSVLSDQDGEIARKYKVLFEVNEAYQNKIAGKIQPISKINNSPDALLPVPASYIIDQDGNISWFHYSIDYRKRASVEEIAKYLK